MAINDDLSRLLDTLSKKYSSGRRKLSRFARNFSDNHPVASSALTFGSAGAATAAMAGLIRDLHTAMEDKKKREDLENEGVGPDTIVLRVPKRKEKAAEDCSCADPEVCEAQKGTHDKVVRKQALLQKEMHVGSYPTAGTQRDLHGQFTDAGEKIASTGALNRTAQILAGIGGGALGYMVVQKLHEKLEQKRLKRQIEAAQQEYLGLIDGSSKYASARSVFLMDDPVYGGMGKEAGIVKHILNLPSSGKNLTATALASYIMMALGAGYVTKKVLQSKFDQEEPEEEPPKINRILFKSYDPDEANSLRNKKTAEAETFEIDPGAALATIGIMKDCIADSHDPMSKQAADYSFIDKITATPEGKQWLLDAYAKSQGLERDITGRELPGLSAMDKLKYARTLMGIGRNPENHAAGLRGHVLGLVKKDPKSWFALLRSKGNRDLVSHVASNTLSEGLSRGEFGMFARLPVVRQMINGVGNAYLNTDSGREKALARMENAFTGQKAAQSLSDIPAMLSRSSIITDKRNIDLDKKLDRILESLPVKKKPKKVVKHDTEIETEGPEAEEFVMRNDKRLASILNRLKEKGLVA